MKKKKEWLKPVSSSSALRGLLAVRAHVGLRRGGAAGAVLSGAEWC